MQSPITIAGPLTATIPLSPGEEGGWGGVVLRGVLGPPCTVETSLDGQTWAVAAFPLVLGGLGFLRLTREDDSPQATVIEGVAGGATSPTPLAQGVGLANLAVPDDATRLFSLQLPPGTRNLVVQATTTAGDPDLYLRQGAAATPEEHDYASDRAGLTETLTVAQPTPGTYSLCLLAYTALEGLRLTATWEVLNTYETTLDAEGYQTITNADATADAQGYLTLTDGTATTDADGYVTVERS